MASTKDVLDRHLGSFGEGDLKGILSDYAPGAVLFTPIGTPALPRYGFRRRFACALATIMIAIAAWGFQVGKPVVGSVVGWSLVAVAFANLSRGFCVPSFIVRLFLGKVVCKQLTT